MVLVNASVKICKFDPAVDRKPRFEQHKITFEEGATVLDVLTIIHEKHDPGLAFRFGCKKGKCGSCPVEVNGQPVFSCHEPATAEMTIGPHPAFAVIRDLVVDFDRPRKMARK